MRTLQLFIEFLKGFCYQLSQMYNIKKKLQITLVIFNTYFTIFFYKLECFFLIPSLRWQFKKPEKMAKKIRDKNKEKNENK